MRPEILLAALAVALPTITALVGILLGRNDFTKLDARMGAIENRLDSRISGIESKIGGVETRLDARISSLENRFHADMVQVIGKLTELEVRTARLEEKQIR